MGAKVLVVEDEAIIAEDIESTLTALGYEVPGTAASAAEAYALVARERPDLVLMDVRIAGNIDGIEAAAVLRARHDVAVVYLTSHSDDATLARATATEPHGYLLKPFEERDLRAAVEIALHKHKADLKVAERERWLHTTLQSIGDAVIATDGARKVKVMNPAAEELTGWKAAEAVGRDIDNVFKLRDDRTGQSAPSPLAEALETRVVVELAPETSLVRKDGGTLMVDDSAAPILGSRGELLGGVVVFRDVTEKRALEQRVQVSDRLASLGTLATGVAHEVNNPLAVAMANTELARDQLKTLASKESVNGQDLADAIDLLDAAGQGEARVRDVVRDLMSLAQDEGARRSRVRILKPLEAAARMVQNRLRTSRIELQLEIGRTPAVIASESPLVVCFTHLFSNAIDALEARPEGPRRIRVSTRTDRLGRAEVRISDDGIGIARHQLPAVFDPYFTTKQVGAGRGLGLTVCHELIRRLGGSIDIESQPGVGTTVYVRLPAAPELAGLRPEPGEQERQPLAHEREHDAKR